MSVKNTILAFFLLLISFTVNAQLESEIRAYVDSTEMLINNGKKLLLSEIRLMNYEKSAEIYTYLNQKTAENNCSAFTYNEHLIIALITSDWDAFLTKAEEIKTDAYFCYKETHSIQRELYEEFYKYQDLFYNRFQNAGLNTENMELIKLFYTASSQDDNKEKYEAAFKAFKKAYPQTKYADFLNHYFPTPQPPMTMEFAFGATGIFPQGNLGHNFTSGYGPKVEMAFTYDKWYMGFSVQTGYLKTKYAFSGDTNRGETFSYNPGDKFNFNQIGVKSGYSIVRSNHFSLTPFIELGGVNLRGELYPYPADNNTLLLFKSFYTGPGVTVAVKLAQFKGNNANYWNATPPSYLSLQLDAGYSFLFTNRSFDQFTGNSTYAAVKLIWAIGQF